MKDVKRKSISLFSGAGGMDIGIRDAGFYILAEVEFDEHCCATLLANAERQQSGTKVIHADIRTIDPHALMKELDVKEGQIDHLFGGQPCQSFSLPGKQLGLRDERK